MAVETLEVAMKKIPGPVSTVRAEPSPAPCRPATVCLGLLCAVLLTIIIVLCVYYNTGSRRASEANLRLSLLTDELDQLQVNHSTLTAIYNKLQSEKEALESQIKRVCKPCQPGWVLFNFKCYYFSKASQTWADSRADCQNRGADLVIIESAEEQNFTNVKTMGEISWIGLTDTAEKGTFLWVDGSRESGGYWRNNKMEKLNRNGNCVAAYPKTNSLNNWIDLDCSKTQRWICEGNTQKLFLDIGLCRSRGYAVG
ncbi:CD209 antigen-like protein C isoform X3 [Lepisosteus oculatus]|uniref:CD209 antigen-like protein C isoform X3 n=1 Tax=Lepisosteus oculatus TaxID=7918 RepID=UPI003723B191